MVFGLPLAIWFGILTIISLFVTASFGIAVHKFHKQVLQYHLFFAFLTLILAVIHLVLAYLFYFRGIVL